MRYTETPVIRPSDIQLSPFTRTVSETMAYLLEAASEVTRASTQAYNRGLHAMVQQQQLLQQASFDWITDVIGAQSNLGEGLVESYSSVQGGLIEAAEESVRRVGQGVAEVVKSRGDAAAAGVSEQHSEVLSETSRLRSPSKPRSASASTARSGPARWTSEAYNTLTAEEIAEKLPQFSQRELREVEAYEKAHQSRQTVLHKISSLRGQEPVAGYDELNVPEIQSLLTKSDEQLSARVRDYERPRKRREGVLQAAEAQLNKS